MRLGDPGRPEICPIFALHSTFSPDIVEWTAGALPHRRAGVRRLQDEPRRPHDRAASRPFRERRAELAADPGYVEKMLAEGADKARPIVQETLAAVRAAMHFA